MGQKVPVNVGSYEADFHCWEEGRCMIDHTSAKAHDYTDAVLVIHEEILTQNLKTTLQSTRTGQPEWRGGETDWDAYFYTLGMGTEVEPDDYFMPEFLVILLDPPSAAPKVTVSYVAAE